MTNKRTRMHSSQKLLFTFQFSMPLNRAGWKQTSKQASSTDATIMTQIYKCLELYWVTATSEGVI